MPFLWLVFFAYYLASTLLHLYISNLLFVNPITTPFGSFQVSDYMGTFGKTTLFLLALYLAFRCLKGTFRLVTISYWGIWLVTVLVTSRFLLFHPNEYIHYPQYAILAVLLALCIDSDRSKVPWARILFWTTFMGVLDEMNQYFFLCKTHGGYLDFNDMLMNLQGAQSGLLLLYGFSQLSHQRVIASTPLHIFKSILFSCEGIVFFIILCLSCFFVFTGNLHLTAPHKIPPGGILTINGNLTIFLERLPLMMGSWNQTPMGRLYYILTPLEGVAAFIMSGLLYSSFIIWGNRSNKIF